MANSRTGIMINAIFYSAVQLILLTSIVQVSYRSVKEYIKTEGSQSKILPRGFKLTLFIFGLLFNITAFSCIFVVFFKAFAKIIHLQLDESNSIFFGCNLVFQQNICFMIVLFIRIYCICHGTKLHLSFRAIVVFIAAFIISIIIFIILLTTNMHVVSVYVCAGSLCLINGIFMIAMTSLFISKLSILFKDTTQQQPQRQSQFEQNWLLLEIISKTTILSVISMVITFTSCLLLLVRYSKFGENVSIQISSDWLISVNIYSNFACYSLSLKYYRKYYVNLCKKLDSKCRNIWITSIFDIPQNAEQVHQNSMDGDEHKEKVTTNSTKTNLSLAINQEHRTDEKKVNESIQSNSSSTAPQNKLKLEKSATSRSSTLPAVLRQND